MPAQSKSLFWGKFSLNPNVKEDPEVKRKQQLQGNYKPIPQVTSKGFHLYAPYAAELKRERGATCHLTLDIFELKPKPKLINRVFLTIKPDWTPSFFGMYFTWLDPKDIRGRPGKKKPLLIIKSLYNSATTGIESFVAFPNNWEKQAGATNLQTGFWHASDTLGESNELTVGEEGYIEIHVILSPSTGEITPEQAKRYYTFGLRWDWINEKFVPISKDNNWIQDYYMRLQ
jgi:hypothetical protein